MKRLTLLLAGLLSAVLLATAAPQAAPLGAQRASLLTPARDIDAYAWSKTVAVSAPRLKLVTQTIRRFKAANLWTKFDRFWGLAGENSLQARTDWKARAVASAINSPTFTANRGYTGDGLTSYLDTGYVASTDAVNFSLNSSALFVYANTSRSAADKTIAGYTTLGGTSQSAIGLRHADNNAYGLVSVAGANSTTGAVSDALGLHLASRTASNLTTLYKRAVSIGTNATTPISIPTAAIFVCAINANGSPGDLDTVRVAVFGIGGGLNSGLATALNTIIEIWLTAIGAGA